MNRWNLAYLEPSEEMTFREEMLGHYSTVLFRVSGLMLLLCILCLASGLLGYSTYCDTGRERDRERAGEREGVKKREGEREGVKERERDSDREEKQRGGEREK